MVGEVKHTEIGDIPADWEVQTFEETFRVLSNNTLPRADLNNRGGFIRNVHYGDILVQFPEILDCENEDIPYLNDAALITANAQFLQDGDIIIADTAEDETVGKTTEIYGLGDGRMVAGLHTIPCRVKKGDFAAKWLGYYMNSHAYHDQVLPYITGIKVSSISKSAIAETLVLVPPKPEQEVIVGALSDIDVLIANLEKLIEKKEAVKTGAMQELLTGKKRLNGYNRPWREVEIGEIAKVIDPHPSHRAPAEAEFGIPFVGIGDIDTTGRINYKNVRIVDKSVFDEHSQRYNLSKNLVGIGRVASLGKVIRLRDNIGKYTVSPTMAILEFEKVDSIFAYYYMCMPKFQEQFAALSNGSTRQSVGMNLIRKLKISIPDDEEQHTLAKIFDDMNEELFLLKEKASKCRMLKQGMMSELLTGKIRLV